MRNAQGFRVTYKRQYKNPPLCQQVATLAKREEVLHWLTKIENDPKLSSKTVKRFRRAAQDRLIQINMIPNPSI